MLNFHKEPYLHVYPKTHGMIRRQPVGCLVSQGLNTLGRAHFWALLVRETDYLAFSGGVALAPVDIDGILTALYDALLYPCL